MDPVNPSRLKQRNEKYQKGIRLLLCLHKGEAGSGKEIQKQKQKQKKKSMCGYGAHAQTVGVLLCIYVSSGGCGMRMEDYCCSTRPR